MSQQQSQKIDEVRWTRPRTEPCRCGRDARSHCPACGSTNLYSAKVYRSFCPAVIAVGGTLQLCDKDCKPDVMAYGEGFKCKRCGHAFDDITAFLNCEAPPPVENKKVGLTRGERKLADERERFNAEWPAVAHLEGKERDQVVKRITVLKLMRSASRDGSLKPEFEAEWQRLRQSTPTSTSTPTDKNKDNVQVYRDLKTIEDQVGDKSSTMTDDQSLPPLAELPPKE